MQYLRYTSDDGNTYSVKTRERYLGALNQTAGGTVALGFGAFNAADELMPRGMKMRGVYVQDASGGAIRFLPVGSTTAPAWTTPGTVQIDYSGIGTLTDSVIVSRKPEKPARVPHNITFHVSDAS
jgi:hypothetical protein